MGNLIGEKREEPHGATPTTKGAGSPRPGLVPESSSPLTAKETDSLRHQWETWVGEEVLHQGGVAEEVLKAHFNIPFLAAALVEPASSFASWQRFAAVNVRPVNSRKNVEMLWDLICRAGKKRPWEGGRSDLFVYATIVCNCCSCCGGSSSGHGGNSSLSAAVDEAVVLRMVHFILGKCSLEGRGGDGALTSALLQNFVNEFAPQTSLALTSYFVGIFFPFDKSPTFVPFESPFLVEPSSIITSAELIPFALFSSAMQGSFRRMYSSSTDGYAFEHVLQAITGYSGPTLFLIKVRIPKQSVSKEVVVFGAAIFSKWLESSNKWYGTSSNFLFGLSPFLCLCRSQGNESNYQWCTTKTSSKAQHGIAFGGSSDLRSKRIFVPASLEDCVATSGGADLTYEPGVLVPPHGLRDVAGNVFDIDTIEIYAIGGAAAIKDGMKARTENRSLANDTKEKARKVDKAAFLGHLQAFGETTFEHRAQQQGRGE